MKRFKAFLLIGFIYILALSAFYVLFIFLRTKINPLLAFLLADIASTLIVFLFSTICHNTSVYDPYWSILPVVAAPLFYNFDFNNQFYPLALIMLGLIEVWGLRLTINWAIHFKGLAFEDWRYTKFRSKGKVIFFIINLFGLHLFPTMVVFLAMLSPISFFNFLAASNFTNAFNLSSILAILIGLFAVIIEIVADSQSLKYRKLYPGEILNRGVWKYSRHPNYLGEILFWLSLYLFTISLNNTMWVLFLGPLAMVLLFGFVSIPMMEKHLLAKYPEYKDYQVKTNVLLLLPPKK